MDESGDSITYEPGWLYKFLLICHLLGNSASKIRLDYEFSCFSDQDWEEFCFISRVHSVTELLYPQIKVIHTEGFIPEEVLERFKQFVYSSASKNSWLLKSGKEVVEKLLDNGIETLALKGFFLQQSVYADDEIRPMNDIDLLVRREDIPKAVEILNNIGFRMESHFDPELRNEDIKHVPPMWNDLGQLIELHWNLLEENEPFDIDMDQVWAQKTCFADKLWGLSVEHLIVHLAIHGVYQHYLRLGLRSLLDLTRVIEKYSEKIQWDLVASTARNWDTEKSLWLSLKLAERYLSVALPEEFILSLEPTNHADMFERASKFTESLKPIRTALEVQDFKALDKLILKRF